MDNWKEMNLKQLDEVVDDDYELEEDTVMQEYR